jgi:hypothetical protein
MTIGSVIIKRQEKIILIVLKMFSSFYNNFILWISISVHHTNGRNSAKKGKKNPFWSTQTCTQQSPYYYFHSIHNVAMLQMPKTFQDTWDKSDLEVYLPLLFR